MLRQSSNVVKRCERSRNWSYEEKLYLLDLCSTHLSIIENKSPNVALVTLKKQAWEIIHLKFTKSLKNEISCNRLRQLWRRMKVCTIDKIMDYQQMLSRYGRDIADKKRPSLLDFKIWEVLQEAKNACRSEEIEIVDYSKDQLALEDGVFDNVSLESDRPMVEMMDETSDSKDGPSNSKRPYSNKSNSALLNDDDTPSLPINNVAATLDTLKILKSGQLAGNVPSANGEDLSFEYSYSKFIEMQTREHEIRMEILQVQLDTAKINHDIAELNKMRFI